MSYRSQPVSNLGAVALMPTLKRPWAFKGWKVETDVTLFIQLRLSKGYTFREKINYPLPPSKISPTPHKTKHKPQKSQHSEKIRKIRKL